MKTYMQPGEYGYFAKRKIRCIEVTPDMKTSRWWCKDCCFAGSVVCHWMHCLYSERADGKTVMFVYAKTREKK